MIRVFQVKCSSQENKEIEKQLLKKLNISKKDLFSWRIHRKSVDARKQKVLFSYVIDCQIKNEKKALKDKDVQILSPVVPYVSAFIYEVCMLKATFCKNCVKFIASFEEKVCLATSDPVQFHTCFLEGFHLIYCHSACCRKRADIVEEFRIECRSRDGMSATH